MGSKRIHERRKSLTGKFHYIFRNFFSLVTFLFPHKSWLLPFLFNYREKARQGGLRGWQNFSGVPCRRRPREKTITLAEIKAIA